MDLCKQAQLLWHDYILLRTPEALGRAMAQLADDCVIIGTGKHEFYLSRAGMEQALACLKRAGRTRPAFVAGIESWLAPGDLRVKYFFENAARFGLQCDPDLVLCGNYPIVKAPHVGYELCEKLIRSQKPFDSLLCMTDMMALGSLKALFDYGYKIPQDVSVIGCDDLDFTGFFQPALTTIAVDKKAEAYAYVDLILDDEVSDRDVVRVNTKLVERSSV